MDIPSRRLSPTLQGATLDELRRHPPFDRMERDPLEGLVARLELVYFAPDTTVLSPASGEAAHLFIVKQGAVLGFGEGEEASDRPRWRLEVGECFPIGALIASRAVTSVYRAAGDVFCYRLPRSDFDALLSGSEVFRDFTTQRLATLLVESRRSQQRESIGAREQPLERRLAEVVSEAPVTCGPSQTIRAALTAMHEAGTDSVLVLGDTGEAIGIFTLRDLRDRVVLADTPVTSPIALAMTRNPVTMASDARAFEAALKMAEGGFRHIVVADRERALGIVTEAELFASPQLGVTAVSAAIRQAVDVPALSREAMRVRTLARQLGTQGMAAEPLTRMIATLNDLLTQRIVWLAASRAGVGLDEFCWLSFGSEGRHEQTFATDQDNGLLFTMPPGTSDIEAQRERMLGFARQVNEDLAACGFARCEGEVMAGNRRWCLTLQEWQGCFASWLRMPDGHALLNSSIFFDLRPLAGDIDLGAALANWLAETVPGHGVFLRLLATNALSREVPLGLIRDFSVAAHGGFEDTLDLKGGGSAVFVDAARVLALGVVGHAGTAQRLRAVGESRRLDAGEVDAWLDAFHFIQQVRLDHQLACLDQGRAPDNYVAPDALNALDRRILREALRQARKLQERLRLDYRL